MNRALLLILCLIIFSCNKGKKESVTEKKKIFEEEIGEIISFVSPSDSQNEIKVSTKNKIEKVNEGTKVISGGKVETKNANALIRFKNGSLLTLNSNTVLEIDSQSNITLKTGEIWIDTSQAVSEPQIEIQTPEHGKVRIEGTVADVKVEKENLNVSVVSGKARLIGERGEIEILAGQEITAEAGKEISLEPIGDAVSLASWGGALRNEIARRLSKESDVRNRSLRGLGNLTANLPGSNTPLPFEMLSQKVSVHIHDQIALTRVEQTFRNPTNSIVEGTYKFPLPPGAIMNRFDMEINGRMMTGEIVERQRGRRILQSIIDEYLWRMRDPALTEWESGTTFKTRIFPIKPKEKKAVALTYIQVLEGEKGRYRYTLPFANSAGPASVIPEVKIETEISSSSGAPVVNTPLYPAQIKVENGKATVSFEAKDFSPVVDFVIDINNEGQSPEATLVTWKGKKNEIKTKKDKNKLSQDIQSRSISFSAEGEEDNFFMLTLRPKVKIPAENMPEGMNWIFLIDTSQSITPVQMETQKRLLQSIVANLSRHDRIKVISFDWKPVPMSNDWEVPSKTTIEKISSFLDSKSLGGATNIERALLESAKQTEGKKGVRVVLIGDGSATLGENRPSQIAKFAHELFKETGSTLTTIATGSSVDTLMLSELALRTGGKSFTVSSGEDPVESAIRVITSLRAPAIENAEVSFEGVSVSDVFPNRIRNLTNGEEITICGKYNGSGTLSAKLSGNINGKEFSRSWSFNVEEGKRGNSFVPIVWASRKIEELTKSEGEKSRKEIIAISKQYSIPSRFTSFIVLENEQMYEEFGVQRKKDRIEWAGNESIEYQEQEVTNQYKGETVKEGILQYSMSAIKDSDTGDSALFSEQAPVASSQKATPQRSERKGAEEISKYKYENYGDALSLPSPEVPYHSQQTTTIIPLPVNMDEKVKMQKIQELKQAIETDPLNRRNRINYINFLKKIGDFKSAFEESKKWYEIDSSNPLAIKTFAELLRLKGNLESSLRIYSGVLDVAPEETSVMKNLAGYFEINEMWEDAYPFRVSMNLVRPSDKKTAVARAISAARAGRWDDAIEVARNLIIEGKNGKVNLKPGLSISGLDSELILSIAREEKTPLLFEKQTRGTLESSKLVIELKWEKNVDLDLWVLDSKGNFLGSGRENGNLIPSGKENRSEIFYMKDVKDGTYKVQVSCGGKGDCGTLSGTINIKAPYKSRTIPFVINENWGGEIAKIVTESIRYAY